MATDVYWYRLSCLIFHVCVCPSRPPKNSVVHTFIYQTMQYLGVKHSKDQTSSHSEPCHQPCELVKKVYQGMFSVLSIKRGMLYGCGMMLLRIRLVQCPVYW